MAEREEIQKLLDLAGIEIDGPNEWDIKVHNPQLFRRVLAEGSLGLGESYMDGWWDVPRLDMFFDKVFRANIDKKVVSKNLVFNTIRARVLNMQSKSRSVTVAEQHYDLGNDFYSKMLDKRMLYTCAYWKNAKDLDEAQEHKLDMICKKIQLKKGETVLDIGCGWGSFSKYAAEKYGAKVTAVNISKEQVEYARNSCKGLDVDVQLKDYRDVEGQYDKVVAIGIMEHIGYKNYREFMEVIHRSLKDNSLALVHTIGCNKAVTNTDPWIDKYIFPNSMLPSPKQVTAAVEGLFVLEDWHNFGADYDKTLMAWDANFEKHWPEFKDKYGERFYRMWKFYLMSCAGTFRSRKNQLWQLVLSKGVMPGVYETVR